MKNNIKQVVIFIVAFSALVSCYNNKGNYDYVDIREVTIELDTMEDGRDTIYYCITNKDVITIEPKITTTLTEFDPNDFEFSWKLENHDEILGTDMSLTYPVFLQSGFYYFIFSALDKQTNIKYSKQIQISVSNNYSTGLMALTEDSEGYAKLDIVSTVGGDTVIYKDILAGSGVPQYKNPIDLCKGVYYRYNEINIMTEEGTYFVNQNTLAYNPLTNDLKYQIVAPFEYWEGKRINKLLDPNGRTRYMHVGDNVLRFESLSGALYTFPINIYADSLSTFKASPEIMTSFKRPSSYAYYLIMYDEVEKRFAYFHSTARRSIKLLDSADDEDIFKWQTGLDMVKTFPSWHGTYGDITSILTDGNGKYYAYRYYIYTSSSNVVTKISKTDISDAEGIATATNYFASATQPYIFYTSGNTVYSYDLQYSMKGQKLFSLDDTIVDIYDAPENASRNSDRGANVVYIATFGDVAGSGKIYKYIITDSANKMELLPALDDNGEHIVWSGFDRIVDMQHKFY